MEVTLIRHISSHYPGLIRYTAGPPALPILLLALFLFLAAFILIQLRADKEIMLQRLLGRQAPVRIQFEQFLQKRNGLQLGLAQRPLFLASTAGPDDDALEREALLADGLDVGLEDGAVHGGAGLHALLAEDAGDLDHGVDVVGRVEEGEAARQQGQQDHARGPDVDLGGLRRAFEEDFGGAEAAGSGSVGPA